jgi:4a-hydroxytetrahydrobiopterin dehydratase
MELLPPQSRWQLTPSGEGIQRLFRFKTFKAAWSFMERVAGECKTAKHHPEWANVYNTVFVRWTTHKPKGLSEKDIAMAMFCDEHAAELGEVVPEDRGEEAAMGEGVEGLVEGIGKIAGDCCVPKKK